MRNLGQDNVILIKKLGAEKERNYTLVKFYLVPNYDLIKFIVSQLGDIIIEEPKHLKSFIRTHFDGLISFVTTK